MLSQTYSELASKTRKLSSIASLFLVMSSTIQSQASNARTDSAMIEYKFRKFKKERALVIKVDEKPGEARKMVKLPINNEIETNDLN